MDDDRRIPWWKYQDDQEKYPWVPWLYVAFGIGGLVRLVQTLNDNPGLIGGFLADLFRWLAAR